MGLALIPQYSCLIQGFHCEQGILRICRGKRARHLPERQSLREVRPAQAGYGLQA